MSYLLIHNEVLPALRERGVSQEQIDELERENPRRFFG
jgi:phosphotriesterase-related protein